MEQELGFKELYDVSLKATYPIEIGDRKIEIGETIARFDKISIANFQEFKNFVSANGGYDNRPHVWWEETKEIKLSFSQGIFSKTQLALMTNAKLVHNNNQAISINIAEHLESGENKTIFLSHEPNDKPIFVYDIKTGNKMVWQREGKILTLDKEYLEVEVDYWYDYSDGCDILTIGQSLISGFVSFIGKTRVKDDITGQVKTGIISIPKLKLMSDLSMRLGSDAVPLTGKLDAVAVPVGAKGQKKVMEITFLSEDIDADM